MKNFMLGILLTIVAIFSVGAVPEVVAIMWMLTSGKRTKSQRKRFTGGTNV